MPSHRRDFHRFAVNSLATLDNGTTVIVKDVSTRGAGIISYSPIEPRSEVTIALDIPEVAARDVKKAKVAWCRGSTDGKWNCGLDFGMNNRLSFLS